MKTGGSLSIWFFIGASLLVNGLLIFGAGVYELFHPPEEQVVLHGLHANVWWGGILAVIGGVYCIYFAPGKGRL
ncbi:MAG: hypothetical protein AUF67_12065 [Acidobacteria bacterium 13_1_20CM_58_21]|nr:MAG: hypothetical protein AUF67_12065 [Acidobacteria bacterium 13_1_20CM_58_21]PYU87112.1 MAG: hypothetical protein DMG51_03300 [Acidobacteriota bacterium]